MRHVEISSKIGARFARIPSLYPPLELPTHRQNIQRLQIRLTSKHTTADDHHQGNSSPYAKDTNSQISFFLLPASFVHLWRFTVQNFPVPSPLFFRSFVTVRKESPCLTLLHKWQRPALPKHPRRTITPPSRHQLVHRRTNDPASVGYLGACASLSHQVFARTS